MTRIEIMVALAHTELTRWRDGAPIPETFAARMADMADVLLAEDTRRAQIPTGPYAYPPTVELAPDAVALLVTDRSSRITAEGALEPYLEEWGDVT